MVTAAAAAAPTATTTMVATSSAAAAAAAAAAVAAAAAAAAVAAAAAAAMAAATAVPTACARDLFLVQLAGKCRVRIIMLTVRRRQRRRASPSPGPGPGTCAATRTARATARHRLLHRPRKGRIPRLLLALRGDLALHVGRQRSPAVRVIVAGAARLAAWRSIVALHTLARAATRHFHHFVGIAPSTLAESAQSSTPILHIPRRTLLVEASEEVIHHLLRRAV